MLYTASRYRCILPPVERTQIYLPADLRAKAMARADREERSFAAVVRDALEGYLARDPVTGGGSKVVEETLAWLSENPGNPDAPSDAAQDHDRYLYGTDEG
jgi:hypothetical protein